jgi:hypothetical protein
MSATKIVLALSSLCAVSVATQSNSDVCTTAANYDGTATATMMSTDCDTAIPMLISTYLASDISACSSTYVTGSTTVTEAQYIQQFSTDCCTDGIGPCDVDHSAMCADPTQYSGSAASPVYAYSGCIEGGCTVCTSDCYYTCDGFADIYAEASTFPGWASCSATPKNVAAGQDSTSTWEQTTFVARAYSRARAPGTDSATCSLTPRSQANAGIHLLRWGGLDLWRLGHYCERREDHSRPVGPRRELCVRHVLRPALSAGNTSTRETRRGEHIMM